MILVTGGLGFLGQEIVRRAASRGERRIRCLVRPGTSETRLQQLRQSVAGADLDFVAASFNDPAALRKALASIDIVYHAAASKSGSASAMVANTVVGSDNLFEAAAEAGVSRFVLVSSFAVMGVTGLARGQRIDERVALEQFPQWRGPYALAKQRQETLAWQYAKDKGLPLVVIRPGVIFGPGEEILTTRIGVRMFGVFLHLGGSHRMPLTFVENCADAVVLAGTAPGVEGEVFCIVDDDLPRSRTLVRRYRHEVGRVRSIWIPYVVIRALSQLNVWYSDRTQGHIPKVFTPYLVDTFWKGHSFTNAKAKARLGWRPVVPMAAALDRTYAALRQKAQAKRQ